MISLVGRYRGNPTKASDPGRRSHDRDHHFLYCSPNEAISPKMWSRKRKLKPQVGLVLERNFRRGKNLEEKRPQLPSVLCVVRRIFLCIECLLTRLLDCWTIDWGKTAKLATLNQSPPLVPPKLSHSSQEEEGGPMMAVSTWIPHWRIISAPFSDLYDKVAKISPKSACFSSTKRLAPVE